MGVLLLLYILAVELHDIMLAFLSYEVVEENVEVRWHGRQARLCFQLLGLLREPGRGSNLCADPE